ncbi:MAG: cation-translocating P-type ATPase [Anaerolineales bacterium]|nr:cation-translocating P-type ATPase [Anaerolineales bacterium]
MPTTQLPDPTAPAWHTLAVDAALAEQTGDAAGLTAEAAARRLAAHGPNELSERGAKQPWRILWEQLTAVMVLILIAAAGLSAGLGKWTEAGSILAIVSLFTLLGFFQEYRAERAIAALKKLAVPSVRVRRAGAVRDLPARELVPGDIVLLEAGNRVPADLRLIESVNLRIQEAALTGESEPVEKMTAPLAQAELPLGDRRNLAYLGTLVTYGRGAGLVVGTGMRTELGRIATLIQNTASELTPLQRKLDRVGKLLAAGGGVVALLMLVIGLVRGEPLDDMLLTAISVAVAVVPEGLPAVVTFTLALGAQRMLKRNALIRKLPAVETLGSVTVICSDKTGTLTENRMTVTVVDLAGHRIDLHEPLRQRQPAFNPEDRHPELLRAAPQALSLLMAGGALCNDAELRPDPEAGRLHALGDPTEGALLIAAAQTGLLKDELQRALPRVAELPFDSDRKRMTTVHARPAAADLPAPLAAVWGQAGLAGPAPFLALTKGAVDGLLEIATRVWNNDQIEPLDAAWRGRIQAANDQMARDGMRVLGLGFRPVPQAAAQPDVETDLIFVGLFGLIDPPRPEVRQAVQTCQAAGLRPIMITGDHPLTASFIARELGIAADARVLTGQQLNALTPAEWAAAVATVSVYARVSPEHKLRIVEALRAQGQIVAMTGDGVNDAPALKQADIGVAMGITGTDVSQEAAAMVLRDDNFATIVAAVEEGRVIYDNVRRFVKFSVAGNVGKVAVMLLAPLLGINVALLPLQLLWLNLLTDGLLGLGLGVEPAEKNVMRRPPHSPTAGLFSGGLGAHVIWVGALMGAVALGVGAWYFERGWPQWQTMIFTTLAFLQVGQALATRSMRESFFTAGPLSNRLLISLALMVVGLQLAVIYLPGLESFFGVTALSSADLALCAALGSLAFLAVEAEKFSLRRRPEPSAARSLQESSR